MDSIADCTAAPPPDCLSTAPLDLHFDFEPDDALPTQPPTAVAQQGRLPPAQDQNIHPQQTPTPSKRHLKHVWEQEVSETHFQKKIQICLFFPPQVSRLTEKPLRLVSDVSQDAAAMMTQCDLLRADVADLALENETLQETIQELGLTADQRVRQLEEQLVRQSTVYRTLLQEEPKASKAKQHSQTGFARATAFDAERAVLEARELVNALCHRQTPACLPSTHTPAHPPLSSRDTFTSLDGMIGHYRTRIHRRTVSPPLPHQQQHSCGCRSCIHYESPPRVSIPSSLTHPPIPLRAVPLCTAPQPTERVSRVHEQYHRRIQRIRNQLATTLHAPPANTQIPLRTVADCITQLDALSHAHQSLDQPQIPANPVSDRHLHCFQPHTHTSSTPQTDPIHSRLHTLLDRLSSFSIPRIRKLSNGRYLIDGKITLIRLDPLSNRLVIPSSFGAPERDFEKFLLSKCTKG